MLSAALSPIRSGSASHTEGVIGGLTPAVFGFLAWCGIHSGTRASRIDFSGILNRVKAATPDVLMAASVRLEDLVAINRQMSSTLGCAARIQITPAQCSVRALTLHACAAI
jgi:hypothetical protein